MAIIVRCRVVLLSVSSDVFAQMKRKLEMLEKKMEKLEHSATTFHHLGEFVRRKRRVDPTLAEHMTGLLDALAARGLVFADQFSTVVGSEDAHQQFMMDKVTLYATVVDSPHVVLNTSSSHFVHNPTAKFDILLCCKRPAMWASIVSFVELKKTMEDATHSVEVLGQIEDRCAKLFEQQPMRQFVICACGSANSLFFAHVTRSHQWITTPVLPLSESYLKLMAFLAAPAELLGFTSEASLLSGPMPMPPLRNQPACSLIGAPSFFKSLSAAQIATNSRCSAVALCTTTLGPLIIKLGVDLALGVRSLENEATVLRQLARTQSGPTFIPTLLDFYTCEIGIIGARTPFTHALAILPVGEPLSFKTTEHLALVMHDVARAIWHAWECQIVHRDVSPANIVLVPSSAVCGAAVSPPERALLIDWHVATEVQTDGDRSAPIVTGTGWFVSCVHGPHQYSHDLESLFYSACFMAAQGYLPWKHQVQFEAVRSMKMMFLIHDWSHVANRIPEGRLRQLLGSLRALFQPAAYANSYQIDRAGNATAVNIETFLQICAQFAGLSH